MYICDYITCSYVILCKMVVSSFTLMTLSQYCKTVGRFCCILSLAYQRCCRPKSMGIIGITLCTHLSSLLGNKHSYYPLVRLHTKFIRYIPCRGRVRTRMSCLSIRSSSFPGLSRGNILWQQMHQFPLA